MGRLGSPTGCRKMKVRSPIEPDGCVDKSISTGTLAYPEAGAGAQRVGAEMGWKSFTVKWAVKGMMLYSSRSR